MKKMVIPAMFVLFTAISGNAMAQSKGKAAAPAAKPTAAAPAAAVNPADLEGKWKVDHVDVDIKNSDGEETKEPQPGGDDDFMEFKNGTMTSFIGGISDNRTYTVSGSNIATKTEAGPDTIKILSLSKTTCVLLQTVNDDSQKGTLKITLKK